MCGVALKDEFHAGNSSSGVLAPHFTFCFPPASSLCVFGQRRSGTRLAEVVAAGRLSPSHCSGSRRSGSTPLFTHRRRWRPPPPPLPPLHPPWPAPVSAQPARPPSFDTGCQEIFDTPRHLREPSTHVPFATAGLSRAAYSAPCPVRPASSSLLPPVLSDDPARPTYVLGACRRGRANVVMLQRARLGRCAVCADVVRGM